PRSRWACHARARSRGIARIRVSPADDFGHHWQERNASRLHRLSLSVFYDFDRVFTDRHLAAFQADENVDDGLAHKLSLDDCSGCGAGGEHSRVRDESRHMTESIRFYEAPPIDRELTDEIVRAVVSEQFPELAVATVERFGE